MPRFFTGDELGAIKSVSYSQAEDSMKEWKASIANLFEGSSSGKSRAVQKLALGTSTKSETLLAAARADGTTTLHSVKERTEVVSEWKEPRLKEGQRFVGLAARSRGIYTCSSNGALRLTKLGEDGNSPTHESAVIPMRLADWRLTSSEEYFAYAGDEVELSVWSTEKAFASPTVSSVEGQAAKRKRGDQLLPGETWRAKNLSNDNLNLRQPVRNTALNFLQPSPSASQHHLLVGTQLGDVRRYDTRAARRPVANWKGIGKIGGVGVVEKGYADHEAFVADHGCNLFALDLRNGKIVYGYKGISGAITSLAPSPALLASVSQDRFFRLHSSFPPAEVGGQQENKGEVLDKQYLKVVPTVVLWDQITDDTAEHIDESEAGEDDVWNEMEVAEDEEASDHNKKKRKTG